MLVVVIGRGVIASVITREQGVRDVSGVRDVHFVHDVSDVHGA